MAPWRRCWVAVRTGVGARFGTRRPASYGHPRCRERATCVPGPGHCEPPDGKRGNSRVPGCGSRSWAVRDSLADRIREGKKSFCCVTTRQRNLWVWNGLGHGSGPLAARALSLGVPGFGGGVLAMLGLPPHRLPAADLPPAFRLLAVALVPTPRLVRAPAPFAQADPRARAAPSGPMAVLSFNVVGAHGRLDLPREKLGEDVSPSSSGAIKTRTRRLHASLRSSERTRQRTKRL
jgi:hypothetical protein